MGGNLPTLADGGGPLPSTETNSVLTIRLQKEQQDDAVQLPWWSDEHDGQSSIELAHQVLGFGSALRFA